MDSDMEDDVDIEESEYRKRRRDALSGAVGQAQSMLGASSGQRSQAAMRESQLDDQAMQMAMQASLQDWQKSFWGHMRGDGSGAAASASQSVPAYLDASPAQSAPAAIEYMQGSDDQKFEYLKQDAQRRGISMEQLYEDWDNMKRNTSIHEPIYEVILDTIRVLESKLDPVVYELTRNRRTIDKRQEMSKGKGKSKKKSKGKGKESVEEPMDMEEDI